MGSTGCSPEPLVPEANEGSLPVSNGIQHDAVDELAAVLMTPTGGEDITKAVVDFVVELDDEG